MGAEWPTAERDDAAPPAPRRPRRPHLSKYESQVRGEVFTPGYIQRSATIESAPESCLESWASPRSPRLVRDAHQGMREYRTPLAISWELISAQATRHLASGVEPRHPHDGIRCAPRPIDHGRSCVVPHWRAVFVRRYGMTGPGLTCNSGLCADARNGA